MTNFFSKLIFIGALMLAIKSLGSNCVPLREFIPSNESSNGNYLRVHPSGDYALYSGGRTGGVEIVDFTKIGENGKPISKLIKTPMSNEAYPVEGRWDLIASPYDKLGMSYYPFNDFADGSIQDKAKISPIFSDKSHDEYYHSSAELPGGKKGNYDFRTTLWKDRWTKDYSVTTDASGKREVKPKGERYQICQNIFAPPKPKENVDLVKIQAQLTMLENEYFGRAPFTAAATMDRKQEIQTEYTRVSLLRGNNRGQTLSQPILSKDGSMIAGIPSDKSTTHIYKIKENGDCELVKDLGIRTSKVSFSYSEKNQLPMLTYTAEGSAVGKVVRGVYVYDLQTEKSFPISTEAAENASYPGFTRDGRIVYKARDSDGKTGFLRVDAVSVATNGSKCAVKGAVSKSESKSRFETTDPSRNSQ
jgi:hypothetical protein